MVPQGALAPARVLVTGAGGLMGRAFLRAWSERAEVHGRSRSELDVTDGSAVAAVMDEVDPQVVINAAGYTNVDGAETDKEAANAVNVGGAVNIARACKQRGALLVSLGSDYVFDGTAGRPYVEQDATGPLGHYGWSQLGGERASLTEGGEVLHLRVQALYGLDRPTLLDRLLAMDDADSDVRMVADRISQPSFAEDVAAAAVGLIAAGARGIVHVANPGPVSWYDFALMVFGETGRPAGRIHGIPAAERTEPALRPAYSALDVSLCERLLGRKMRSVREALQGFLGKRK